MKKVLSIITAGLALLTVFSCVKEEEKLIFDPADAVAPVVGKYELTDNGLAVHYTPAQVAEGIQKPTHGLILTKVDGKAVEAELTATEKEAGVLTVSKSVLNKALTAQGVAEGATCSFSVVVRAAIAAASFALDSESAVSISGYEVPAAPSNPWADFKEVSAWGVTGSIASAGLNWDADITMYTDGGRHVARNVKLTPSDQFKFRKDHAWGENFGGEGDAEPFVCELGTEYPAIPGGKNLGVAAEGVYDLMLDTDAGTFTVTEAFLTYPGFTESSPWSVIGAIESFEMSWDKDIAMTTDGEWHVAEGVELKASDQFKFRKDQAWGENFGAEGDVEPFVADLDVEYPAVGNGKNLAVAADGVYDLLVNPDAGLFKVVATLGGKSGLVGGDTPGPGPEPEPVVGWNIIGLNGDWDNDVLAKEVSEGVWTANITAKDATEFKWRKDGDWAENYGGVMVALGEPFDAVANGDNIKLAAAGFYAVTLDLNALKITVSSGEVWSLIGVNGDWDNDIDMTKTSDGLWVSPATKIAGEFKLRENHGWDNNRGGVLVALGDPFAAVAGGDNIKVEEGTYIVTYNPSAETIVVDACGWGLVGTINGWGNDAPDTPLVEEGLFLVAKNVALTDSDEIKLRYNQSWDVNRGGLTVMAVPVKAVPGGDNLKPGAGNFDIYYRPDCEVIIINPAGTDISYWGVVGTINGWGDGQPDLILYQDAEGKLLREGISIAASDQIKIRQNESWGVNRGGAFSSLDAPFAVVADGPNIVIGREGVINLEYNAQEETITITGELTGDVVKPSAWSVIGTINDTSWSVDFDLTNTEGDIWKISGLTVTAADEFKIRADHDWAISVGGPEENDASIIDESNPYGVFKPEIGTAFQAGDKNIHIGVAGKYDVTFDYAAKTILIEAAAGAPSQATITIDGNFDDWATVPGAEPASVFNAFKVWNDADNFYFYVETDPGSRLWEGGAYLYLYFDWDNDLTTGEYSGATGMNGNNYEAYTYMFIFENNQIGAPTSSSVAKSLTLDNLQIAGSDSTAEIVKFEISIPRADFAQQVKAGDVIGVNAYRSKDGGNVNFPGYVVK